MIRFANESDIPAIMAFIETYWKHGHILGNNLSFFKYEHLLPEGVTYVIAEQDGCIQAILGYIPYGKENRDIMTVMWKANHDSAPSIGLELFHYLVEHGDARLLASPGSSRKLEGLYRYLGYRFGKMTQWYRLNSDADYKIAKVSNYVCPPPSDQIQDFCLFDDWDHFNSAFNWNAYKKSSHKPYKEAWYIKKRYFDHPIHNYLVYGMINASGKVDTAFVFRIVSANESRALRLLDCIGDYQNILYSCNMLDSLMRQTGSEYVDCYECGLDDHLMLDSGWLKVRDSGNIIPNYFSPFVQENIDIYYFSTDPEIVLFKADGDQDRPN